MDGAIDLLQKYLSDNGLPYSQIKGLLGAHDEEQPARDNWSSMEDIISEFNKLNKKLGESSKIVAKRWEDGLDSEDTIYFLSFEFHCFVLLYKPQLDLAYIADGRKSLQD